MVVAEQVQDAVGGEQDQLVVHRMPGGAGLPDGDRRAEDDVAEQRRAGLGVVGTRGVQLVHGERQHVRGPGLAHPALMQVNHDLLIHEQHRELGQRVNVQLTEDMAGHRGEPGLIDAGP